MSEQMAHEVIQVEDLVDDADRFDIIHSHVEYLLPLASGRLTTPVVSTLHGRLDRPQIRVLCQTYRPALASISDAQRTALADLDLDWVATVYNGLPLRDLFRLGRGDGSYLAFLGRISEEKDPETPIRVAIRAGTPIKIAARVDPADEPYFRARVMPHLGHPLVEWTGQLDDRQKATPLEGAVALLMPVNWPEPFGLTFVEALAAGTPVISRRRGSLPELIDHRLNGFLCDGEDELVEACHMALQLARHYVQAYRPVLARPASGAAASERDRYPAAALEMPVLPCSDLETSRSKVGVPPSGNRSLAEPAPAAACHPRSGQIRSAAATRSTAALVVRAAEAVPAYRRWRMKTLSDAGWRRRAPKPPADLQTRFMRVR